MSKIVVVGASGLVGRTIVSILEERHFPVEELKLLASSRSAGTSLSFRGQELTIEPVCESSFQGSDLALFAAGADVSKTYVPYALEAGCKVVDNSSHFRMQEDVALVVPEVNPEAIQGHALIANPNCSTIQCMAPLYALDRAYGVKRIVYSTYQSVSGSGLGGLADLDLGTHQVYPHPITANVLPQIDDFLDNGYTKEEMKMVNETRKILGRANLPITATAVRVPVRYGHAVAINVELAKDFTLSDVREKLRTQEGVVLQDDPAHHIYPMPLQAEKKDPVFVGRIRRDDSVPYGLNLWTVADNIRKGAALNAVQIAEILEGQA